ncbi:MAG: class I SAM-dependent methyltransferase [Candidatus Berkiellales bacterium]
MVDLGTGDGSFVLHRARAHLESFFIGIDSNADNLRESSHKAAKSTKKGGLPNALFVHANVEALPDELSGVASEVTINLPWGSLLKAVALPDPLVLKEIAKLCQPKAILRIVFGYELSNEQKIIEQLGLPTLDDHYLNTTLTQGYLEAGFAITWQKLNQEALKNYPTTWAKKLAYGKERLVIEIKGV